jgi:hypothetical protein
MHFELYDTALKHKINYTVNSKTYNLNSKGNVC